MKLSDCLKINKIKSKTTSIGGKEAKLLRFAPNRRSLASSRPSRIIFELFLDSLYQILIQQIKKGKQLNSPSSSIDGD